MDLAFLTPLYERPGPWASVYVDAARHRASTAEERTLEALAVQRALARAGADGATCHAVRMAVDELRHADEPSRSGGRSSPRAARWSSIRR
ncbi:hypothetical protein ABII15_31925 [Streptomyces sp. HUAS MG91]|uniref:DUF5753 domain-containing protein n=1 Tax=Streptomyces tabacisoli TaxID=3156398 RepID=A0AAU8J1H3_9ACTN